jgi:hypothetical protein
MSAAPDRLFCINPSSGWRAALMANGALHCWPKDRITESGLTARQSV